MTRGAKSVVMSGSGTPLEIEVLKMLLAAEFKVMFLTRDVSRFDPLSARNYKIIETQFESAEEVAELLETTCTTTDALILNAHNDDERGKYYDTTILIDAAAMVGIQRVVAYAVSAPMQKFIIQEGIDIARVWSREQKYLVEKADENLFTYTVLQIGLLLDDIAGLVQHREIKSFVHHDEIEAETSIDIYRGGNVRFSIASAVDIGLAVVKVLKKADQPKMTNQWLNVESAVVTQKMLLAHTISACPDETHKFSINQVRNSTLEARAWISYGQGDRGERGGLILDHFLRYAVFSLELGLFEDDHHELLGFDKMDGDALTVYLLYLVESKKARIAGRQGAPRIV